MRTIFAYIILMVTLNFSPVVSASSPEEAKEDYFFTHDMLSCLDCHSYIKENQDHPSIEDSNESCMECHEGSLRASSASKHKVKCLNCHSRHPEKISNDAHINVPCRACHLYGIKSVKETENNVSFWRYKEDPAFEYSPHRIVTEKEDICSRCHFKGNTLGAPDQKLPAKSFICMPCHAATFSMGDISSVIAVIIFMVGIISIICMWLAAGKGHSRYNGNESASLLCAIKGLISEGVFQKRLLRVSFRRWIIHAMIFFPFVIRFLWGIAALVASLLSPEWSTAWIMLDKNNPVTGLVFDITGLLILTGGCMIVIEKRTDKKLINIKNLPKNNVFVNILLGGMIFTGFIVEGVRITITGSPEGSQFAFIGYGISRILIGYHLNGIYVYLWYLHAFMTALFIAYLPFSRMFHIFAAPLSLFIRGTSSKR